MIRQRMALVGQGRRGRAARTGLLIDWGGVLTTNLFASFHAYCLARRRSIRRR